MVRRSFGKFETPRARRASCRCLLRLRVDVRVLERAAPARVSRIISGSARAQSIQLHDPFLSKDELEALEALGIEQAQPPRSAKPYHGARSLYFMPHCPAQIYADVLKGFDKALDELLIVGNSFLSYAKRRIGDDLHPGIREALPLLREVRLDVGLAGDALERPLGIWRP